MNADDLGKFYRVNRKEYFREGRETIEDDGTRTDLFPVDDPSEARANAVAFTEWYEKEVARRKAAGVCARLSCDRASTENGKCAGHQVERITII